MPWMMGGEKFNNNTENDEKNKKLTVSTELSTGERRRPSTANMKK